MTARPRRTQEERSADTRRRLMEATLDGLLDAGYGRLTTSDVADRAGVSRGALTHHFDNKDDLVAQSVDHLLAETTAEIRELAGQVGDGRLSLGDFLDRLWAMFSGRLFFVTLEHVTESRHNDVLRERLVPVVRAFHEELDETWREFFRGSDLPAGEVEAALNATLCLMRGMGVQTVLRRDPAYYDGLIGYWRHHLETLIGPATRRASKRRRTA